MPKYSVKYKQKVVTYYSEYGLSKTIDKYGHSNSVVYKWVRKSETVGFMRKQTKTYTKQEKIDILDYYWENGDVETTRKFDIDSSVIKRWERTYLEFGFNGLGWDARGKKPGSIGSKSDINKNEDLLEEVQRLRAENLYLKKLDALVQEREEQERKKKSK